MKVVIVSHTHWDREWYLSQKQFQFQLGRIFDELIALLEADNEYKTFMADGQTSIIEDYLEIRPNQKEAILRLISQKRLSIGPWYTMPDLWLANGESLIRNLMFGKMDCEKFGAEYPNTGYVPDSFGHIEQMPAILNGFGIDNYYFTRGVPMDGTDGHIEFLWIGCDGKSQVTAHILPGNYGNARMLEPVTNLEGLKNQLAEIIRPYALKSINPNIVLGCNGTDHIWVQSDLSEILKKANEVFDDCEFIHGTLEDYNREFEKLKYNLPRKTGCIMGSHMTNNMLHGTWSSRIDNKLDNFRVCEKMLNLAEPLEAMSVLAGGISRDNEINLAWRWILQNHAHDSICGCSQDRVHKDVERRFAHSEEIAEMISGEALELFNCQAVRKLEPTLIRYSGLGGGSGLVEFVAIFDEPCDFHLEDEKGMEYPVQIIKETRLFRQDLVRKDGVYQDPKLSERYYTEYRAIASLPESLPCSLEHYRICEGKHEISKCVFAEGNSMENSMLRVEVNQNGTINVTHKPTGRQYEGLLAFSDEAECGGGYEHFRLAQGHKLEYSTECVCSAKIIENGCLRASILIEFDWQLPKALNKERTQRADERISCHVKTIISLTNDGEEITCKTLFSNNAKDHKLRLLLRNKYHRTQSVGCNRSFCTVTENMSDYTYEEGQNQHPYYSWIATNGLAFCSKGLHEFTLEDDTLCVTLLRAVPFTFESGTWETPDAQLLKELEYDYILMFYDDDYIEGNVPKRAGYISGGCIADVHGTSAPKWADMPYASNYMAEVVGDKRYPVSMHRCCWRKVYSHRDGWRRRDLTRIPDIKVCSKIEPIRFSSDKIILTCFKKSYKNKNDLILRFYNAGREKLDAKISLGIGYKEIYTATMSEDEIKRLDDNSICMQPNEIVTLVVKNAYIFKLSEGEHYENQGT